MSLKGLKTAPKKSKEAEQGNAPTLLPQDISELTDGVQEDTSMILKNPKLKENIEVMSERKIRIYLVRHYPYRNKEKKEVYKELSEIPEEEQQKLKQAYDGIFANPTKTLFLYDNQTGLPRVQSTAKDILCNYPIPEDHIIYDINLAGTYDENEDPLERKRRTIEEFQKLKRIIKQRKLVDIDTIVIVGNSTYTQPFDLLAGGKKDLTLQTMIDSGYLFRDFDSSLKPLHTDVTDLKISPENYQLLRSLPSPFPQIPHSSITDFQDKLNAHFKKHPELYGGCLALENEDLRVFCVTNLLKDNENERGIEMVMCYYKGIAGSISEKEEDILIENIDNPKIKTGYVFLYRNKKVHKLKNNENIEAMSKALEIQSRSLDEKIKKQESDGVLKRGVFWIEKKEIEIEGVNGRIEKRIEYHKNGGADMGGSLHNRYVLPAHVGNGKSIWLSEFVKKVILDYPEYRVCFFEGADFNGGEKDNNVRLLEEKTEIFNSKSIIFIDAIDEICDDITKQKIKELLMTSKNTTIVTGRPSEYNDKENPGFTTLGFYQISKERFLDSRIDNKEKKQKIIKILEVSNLSQEIEGNPLLLNFICILANLDEEEKKKYKNLRIKSLENIGNKADLYESISRLIIHEHFKAKGNSSSREELNSAMTKLGEAAYGLFKGDNLDVSDEYLRKLSILFRKSETGEYQFIHKSFQEFFLAQYFVGRTDGNEEIHKIIYGDKKNSWGKWKGSKPTVMLYGEILSNQGDIEKLEDLLGEDGLLIHDTEFINNNRFGVAFFIGLEILHQLERGGKILEIEKIKNLYINKIKKWSAKDIIFRLINFQTFQEGIGFQENEFIKVFFKRIKNTDLFNQLLCLGLEELGNPELKAESIYKGNSLLIKPGEYGLVKDIFKKKFELGSQYGTRLKENFGLAQLIFIELARLQNKEGIEFAYKYGLELFNTKEYGFSGWLFIELARLQNKEGIEFAYKGGLKLVEAGAYHWKYGGLFEELAELGGKEGIEFAYKGGLKLVEAGNYISTYCIFEKLAKSGGKEGIEFAYKGGLKLVEAGAYHWKAGRLFEKLAKSGGKEGIEFAYKGGLKLVEAGAYWEAKDVFLGLVRLGFQEGMELAYKCGLELFNTKEYMRASSIARELAELLDQGFSIKEETSSKYFNVIKEFQN